MISPLETRYYRGHPCRMAFSPQFLDELRARAGVADVVGRRVRLTRRGHEHQGLCPFHKEKTPSFTVNDQKGFYHCFGCGAHGSVFDFVMQTEGLSFPETVERLAADVGMEVPVASPEERARASEYQTLYGVVEKACVYYETMLRRPEGAPTLQYLKSRGIDDQTITTFRLGFAPDSRGGLRGALTADNVSEDLMVQAGLLIRPEDKNRAAYDRFRGRVIFPIMDRRGRPIAFGGRIMGDGEPKYLNSPETTLFHKGATLYGQAAAAVAARTTGRVLVTEGYMDVIALHMAGFGDAVAPLGTALTEDQMQLLWRIAPEPVLCFDGDAAGARAAARAAERALPILKPGFSFRFAELPQGEDPDSLLRHQGREAMDRILATAQPLSVVLWKMQTRGRTISAPEDRAALQKRLEDLTRTIQDPTVRSHFLKGFKDRIWARPAAGKGRGGARSQSQRRAPSSDALDGRAGPAARVDPGRNAQKVLIAVLINHPVLFHQVEEAFGTLEIADGTLNHLRQSVIAALTADADLESADLRAQLARSGLTEAIGALFRDPLVEGIRATRHGSSIDMAQAVWDENINWLHRAALAGQKSLAASKLAEEITDETWESHRALLLATTAESDD